MNRLALIVIKNLFKIPPAYIRLCRYAKNPQKYTKAEVWAYIQYVMDFVMRSANVDFTVSGLHNLPKQDGFMLYGNHQGMFDVVAVGYSCPNPLAVVYKQELKNVPLLKQIFKCTDSYALDRDDARQGITVMQAVTKQVQEGKNYVIFPEGTRSKTGNDMNEWHAGSFRCALKAKCPIVPMAFIDCFKVLDQKGSKRVSAQLHYLTPIEYTEYKDLKTNEIAQLVKDRVSQAIKEHSKS